MRRQREIFSEIGWSPNENFWCYVVQHRLAKPEGGWEPWESDTRPSHFRREADAEERCDRRREELNSPFNSHFIEFRVVPKYLGYDPLAEDEKWLNS